jgi:DNA-binding PadR family transcriptional regulator
MARCRWWDDAAGTWEVQARVERFVEPALLLLLREGETHGYELAETLEELAPGERVDLGNLYRLLRSLEDEGLVQSRWRDDLPGRAKRTYELTEAGGELLATWMGALERTTTTIAALQRRYRSKGST